MVYRTLKSCLLAAAAVLAAGTAMAGTKFDSQVEINTTYNYAYGSLGAARNSADGYQWISCTVQSGDSGGLYASCFARDASGLSRSCGTSNATMVAVVATLQGDSVVSFLWDSSGLCTYISVGQHSGAVPKVR